MKQVAPNIFISSEDEMKKLRLIDYSLVNLSSTFHYHLHSWVRGKVSKLDPCYVVHMDNHILSLNWVDGAAMLYDWQGQGVKNFERILEFIDTQLEAGRQIVISCNQGISRSPTVALLYLSKRLHAITDESFEKAKEEFTKIYPKYAPKGIADFVSSHWNEIS